MKVSEVMSSPVRSCGIRDTLDCAARLMADHDCGAIPIIDDHGYLVGMVTDRDICMAAYQQDQPLSEIPVTSAMSGTIYAVREDEPLERAEQLMSQKQVRRIPVLDGDNRPIGMVSLGDLATEAAHAAAAGERADVFETLAAVSEHRTA